MTSSEQKNKRDKSMTEEQFEEVVDAILAGKYSWACVLILKAGGYNPLHYIPYRTYNRLIKNNCLAKSKGIQQVKANQSQELTNTKSSNIDPQHLTNKVKDLSYLDQVSNKAKVSGGWRIQPDFGAMLA